MSEFVEDPVTPLTKRGIDIKLRYTQDNYQEVVGVLRTTVDREGKFLTPLTDSLINRAVLNEAYPPIASRNMRYAKITLAVPSNQSGIGEYKIVLPYHPSSPQFKQQIREVYDWVTVSQVTNPLLKKALCVNYYGEDSDAGN